IARCTIDSSPEIAFNIGPMSDSPISEGKQPSTKPPTPRSSGGTHIHLEGKCMSLNFSGSFPEKGRRPAIKPAATRHVLVKTAMIVMYKEKEPLAFSVAS